MNFEASATACVLQVPNWEMAGMTQSPLAKSGEEDERTSKTPSFPGVADGSGVPMREVKGGLAP
jgi:hypothetical protein